MKALLSKLLIVLMLGGTGFLTACNTVEGMGKDVERAGEGVQDATHRDVPEN